MKRWCWVVALVALGGVISAPANEPMVPLKVVLDLADGSRLVGVPAEDGFTLHTELALMGLKLPLVRSVEFDRATEDGGAPPVARVSLNNGDRLTGRFVSDRLAVKACFGEVQVPLRLVRRIMVNGSKMALFFGPGSRASCDDAFLPWGQTPLSFSIWCKLPACDGKWHNAVTIGAEVRHYDRMTLALYPFNSWYLMLLEVYGSNAQFSSKPDVALPEQAGQWVHFCAVYDARQLTLYKNGTEVSSVPMNINRLACGLFAVGNYNLATHSPFNEALSDLRIWKRALSAQEVGRAYAGQAVAEGLIGHWPMDEGSGRTLYDVSGQDHHLKIEGDPTWVDGPDVVPLPPR